MFDKFNNRARQKSEFEERVVQVDRVTYVVAGGKRLRFRTLVVIGNKKGKVGYGLGKATEVPQAVQKAVTYAKKHLIEVPITADGTIPHDIHFKFGAAKIFLKPAKKGTSIIAGGSVRTVLELSGIKNILSKIMGTANKINNVKATILALQSLKTIPEKTEKPKNLKTNEPKDTKVQEQTKSKAKKSNKK